MYAVTSSQMKALEEQCEQQGLSQRMLMENAGMAAAYCINETIPVKDKRCVIFCGKGNNGGDGFVVARHLFKLGGHVTVILTDGEPRNRLPGEMYDKAADLGIEILDYPEQERRVQSLLSDVDIVVDAIYGTGFRGMLPSHIVQACELINDAIAAVFALDLPSGLECDDANGDVSCVNADFTIVFDSLKPVHIFPLTAKFCGSICLVDIGVPEQLKESLEYRYAIVDEALVRENLPVRRPESHKGDYGRLLVIAGSTGYPGAAALAVSAALHSGVGMVRLASVPEVCRSVAGKIWECTHLPLPQTDDGAISDLAISNLEDAIDTASAILMGPGLTCTEETSRLVYSVLDRARCPVILDADGINAVARNINVLYDVQCPLILTPHMGELSRLLGMPVDAIAKNSYSLVGGFAKKYGVTVVCKSHKTFTAPMDIGAYLNTTGNAGLAKGGSGDVLGGIIAALAAQEVSPDMAAACGVWLHGRAADLCAEKLSQTWMQPGDVISGLSEVFLKLDR